MDVCMFCMFCMSVCLVKIYMFGCLHVCENFVYLSAVEIFVRFLNTYFLDVIRDVSGHMIAHFLYLIRQWMSWTQRVGHPCTMLQMHHRIHGVQKRLHSSCWTSLVWKQLICGPLATGHQDIRAFILLPTAATRATHE